MKKLYLCILALLFVSTLTADAAITKQGGWFESAYAEWAAVAEATSYNVYLRATDGSYSKIDDELVRQYPSCYRADVVGLAAGSYQLKVVPVINGAEATAQAMETDVLSVSAHDRSGFAHYNREEGVGAYNNDGTLKQNARVVYVTAANAKTVSLDMQVDSKGKMETRTGLQDIIQAYEKGQEKRPLAVRIIGLIKAADMDSFGSSEEGLQVKGNGSSKCIANLTIEGIGEDATIHGFGILTRAISSVEFRNFAIMICMDDCLSLDTDNKNVWVHNMDFFYGGTGSDSDQAKGDGTVDIKGQSSHVTVSYNHFFDSGKCSLGGMKSETTDCWMSYHHNWFDHSDSRHPRIRTAFYHVYNNYFDGNAKYGVGVTMGGSAFVEQNYFRNCKYPMLISKQGTDAEGDGTFSGEDGGVIKAFDNVVVTPKKLQYYDGKQTDGKWDAVLATSRAENVSAKAYAGGTSYNNAATTEAIKAVPASALTAANDVPTVVCGTLGAGRMNHGDFSWTFNNATEDANANVIQALKDALLNYKSQLILSQSSGEGQEEAPGEDDNPEGGNDNPNADNYKGIVSVTFSKPSSGKVPVATDGGLVSFNSSTNYKDAVVSPYSYGVKLETNTEIYITSPVAARVTLVFDAPSKRSYLNDESITSDANSEYKFTASANTKYTLKKRDSVNLYAVIFNFGSGDANGIEEVSLNTSSSKTYDLLGRRTERGAKGQILIVNGKKLIMR